MTYSVKKVWSYFDDNDNDYYNTIMHSTSM